MKVVKYLHFMLNEKNNYHYWKNKPLNSKQTNEKLLKFLQKTTKNLTQNSSNHEILKKLSAKNRSPEEDNILRCWDETLSYPKWEQKSHLNDGDKLNLHTKNVIKQSIILLNFLEHARETKSYL